ncbi:MAG: ABC transporter substrate-binding protein [Desulfobacteraceae bacterium]|nr:ABC transporter substrate-binding protein [Desulfobacteraceae bacterium]
MKKTIFWFLLLTVCTTSVWWLADILIMSKNEYDQFRGAAHSRQLYAQKGNIIGIAAAGDWATYPSLLNGIRLAVDEINKTGGLLGRTLELIPVDDKGSLEGAFEATQQICDQPGTLFVIGHSDARLTQAVVQNYEFYGILMISPLSANLTQSQKNFQFIFSNSTRIEMIAEKLLALAKKNHWSKVGITYDASDITTRKAHYFESMLMSDNIKIPRLSGIYPDQGPEYLKTLIKNQSENQSENLQIDSLVIVAGIQDSLNIIRGYRSFGFNRPIVLGQEPENHTLTTNKNLLTNVYWPLQINTEASRYYQFCKSYLEKFSTFSDITAVCGYDTLMVLANAVKKAQSLEAVVVAETMKSFRPDHSLTGTIGFDSNGNAIKAQFNFGQTSLDDRL